MLKWEPILTKNHIIAINLIPNVSFHSFIWVIRNVFLVLKL